MKSKMVKKSVLIILLVVLSSCSSLKTALFDQYSYQQSISLKVEATTLISKATTPYALYKDEILFYLKEYEKLTEYEKNKSNNQLSYKMMQLIGNPNKNLLGGFFKYWKEKNTLSPFFITEAKGQITEAFDILIRYESRKDPKQINDFLLNK